MKKETRTKRCFFDRFQSKRIGPIKISAKDLQMVSKSASRWVFYFLLLLSIVLIIICTMVILELSEKLRAEKIKMHPQEEHFETAFDDFYSSAD